MMKSQVFRLALLICYHTETGLEILARITEKCKNAEKG